VNISVHINISVGNDSFEVWWDVKWPLFHGRTRTAYLYRYVWSGI